MAEKFRGNYTELQEVAKLFNKGAEIVAQASKNIDAKMSTLKDGKQWVGKGATRYYNEMDGQVKPALKRLHDALTEGARVSQQMAQVVKRAEDDCSKEFGREFRLG